MPRNRVVLGLQWGDEGKGKVIDLLAADADLVVRCQGGANAGHTVVVNGKTFGVKQNTSGVFEVNGTPYSVGVTPGMPKPASMTSTVPSPTNIEILHDVVSPLPGMVLRIMINPGSSVSTGETILVMESMKMETPINAPTSGVLVSVPVSQGDQLSAGHVLAVIKK